VIDITFQEPWEAQLARPLRPGQLVAMSWPVFSGGTVMSQTSSRDTWGNDGQFRRQTIDPETRPELFEGVLTRRFVAFLIDLVVLTVPIGLAVIFIALFGLLTFGVGWLLFWLVWPLTVVWAVVYYGMTLGGPHSATLGMRMVYLQLRTWTGEPAYFVLGAAHGVLYWISVSVLTPLVVLVGLFSRRRQLLHDLLLGTVIINASAGTADLDEPRRA
jgi:uncharacterized RDD family membrane protein YckC